MVGGAVVVGLHGVEQLQDLGRGHELAIGLVHGGTQRGGRGRHGAELRMGGTGQQGGAGEGHGTRKGCGTEGMERESHGDPAKHEHKRKEWPACPAIVDGAVGQHALPCNCWTEPGPWALH